MSGTTPNIILDGGKYVIVLNDNGTVNKLLRHGEDWPAGDELRFSKVFISLCHEVVDMRKREAARNAAERVAADGTTRKQHYGSGRQPWDDIRDAGWGPEFCASNVLKYLRRDKDRAHSLESARVYYDWLNRLVLEQRATGVGRAVGVLNHLDHLLTPEERATVQEGLTC